MGLHSVILCVVDVGNRYLVFTTVTYSRRRTLNGECMRAKCWYSTYGSHSGYWK